VKSRWTSLQADLSRWPHERLFVAFSGGLDSTVLLKECSLLVPEVCALHINHGLHPDADRWQAHCASVCEKFKVAFSAYPVQVRSGNVEIEARNARYALFDEVLGPGDLLLMGHHRDDQAENVLLRLFQGRLRLAMPHARQLPRGAQLLRPLLSVSRPELEAAASRHGLDWIDDSANAELTFDRNFIRHEVLPSLRSRWDDVETSLVRAADAQQAMDALLTFLVDTDTSLRLGAFPAALRRSVLRVWLRQFGEFAVTDRALDVFIEQLDAPKDRQPALDLARGSLRRHRQVVHYVAKLELQECYPLEVPSTLRLPHGTLSIDADSSGFAADGDIHVRFRRGGERIGVRSVKKLLQQAGIAPWRRSTYPLVYVDDRLVAVPNVAVEPFVADTAKGSKSSDVQCWRARWSPEGH
jgi:tRNA(Ile)-lysidine synthase